jgi:hypothetical protein
MSYSFTMGTTVQNDSWYVNGFTLAPTYRRNLYRNLLYIDVTPGMQFPKQWHFRRTPYLFVQLEMLFGT